MDSHESFRLERMLCVVQFERPACRTCTWRDGSDRNGFLWMNGNAGCDLGCRADGHAIAIEPLEAVGEILLCGLIAIDVDGNLLHVAIHSAFVHGNDIGFVLQPTIGDDLLEAPVSGRSNGVGVFAAGQREAAQEQERRNGSEHVKLDGWVSHAANLSSRLGRVTREIDARRPASIPM